MFICKIIDHLTDHSDNNMSSFTSVTDINLLPPWAQSFITMILSNSVIILSDSIRLLSSKLMITCLRRIKLILIETKGSNPIGL